MDRLRATRRLAVFPAASRVAICTLVATLPCRASPASPARRRIDSVPRCPPRRLTWPAPKASDGPVEPASPVRSGATSPAVETAKLPRFNFDWRLIKKSLARYGGNVSHAASALGLSRSALYRRLQRYGL